LILARFLLDFFSFFFVDLLSICCPSWADFGCVFFGGGTRTLSECFFNRPCEKKTLIRATKERVQLIDELMSELIDIFY